MSSWPCTLAITQKRIAGPNFINFELWLGQTFPTFCWPYVSTLCIDYTFSIDNFVENDFAARLQVQLHKQFLCELLHIVLLLLWGNLFWARFAESFPTKNLLKSYSSKFRRQETVDANCSYNCSLWAAWGISCWLRAVFLFCETTVLCFWEEDWANPVSLFLGHYCTHRNRLVFSLLFSASAIGDRFITEDFSRQYSHVKHKHCKTADQLQGSRNPKPWNTPPPPQHQSKKLHPGTGSQTPWKNRKY